MIRTDNDKLDYESAFNALLQFMTSKQKLEIATKILEDLKPVVADISLRAMTDEVREDILLAGFLIEHAIKR